MVWQGELDRDTVRQAFFRSRRNSEHLNGRRDFADGDDRQRLAVTMFFRLKEASSAPRTQSRLQSHDSSSQFEPNLSPLCSISIQKDPAPPIKVYLTHLSR